MLKNISSLGSLLNREQQKSVKGGFNLGECPIQDNQECFSGPFYCNIHKLPICVELPHEN